MRLVLLVAILIILYSCKGSNSETGMLVQTSTSGNTVIQQKTDQQNYQGEQFAEDIITAIKFNELSVAISRLVVFDEDDKLHQQQKDTAFIYADIAETIEGQKISIKSDVLTNITVEQRYETSVTVMNEWPHCDLTEWKHYYSEWRPLRSSSTNIFIGDTYETKDREKFPTIKIEQLKKEVKKVCGEEWYKHVKNIKSPTDYPAGVGISRYF
jgi:hypothetical protein